MPNHQGQDYDDMSTVGFITRTKGVHERAEELRREITSMSDAAGSQPLAPAIRESLEGLKTMLTVVTGVTGQLYPSGRRLHETDFARAEEPRGGRQAEKHADVAAAEQDGF